METSLFGYETGEEKYLLPAAETMLKEHWFWQKIKQDFIWE